MSDFNKAPWWADFTDSVSPTYLTYIEAEQKAIEIQFFSPFVLPGLCQTESYARTMLASAGQYTVHPKTVEKLVDLRMKRQWHIFERANPPKLEFFIDEALIYRQICSVDELHEQLIHLTKLSKLPFVSFRIAPFARGKYDKHYFEDFKLVKVNKDDLGQPFSEDLIYGMKAHNAVEIVTMYRSNFERLRMSALSESETLDLINKAASELGA